MSLVFATCNVNRAIKFINSTYPDKDDLSKKDIPKLANLIKEDNLRVQDPEFHKPAQIIAGNNYKESNELNVKIDKAIVEMKKALEL